MGAPDVHRRSRDPYSVITQTPPFWQHCYACSYPWVSFAQLGMRSNFEKSKLLPYLPMPLQKASHATTKNPASAFSPSLPLSFISFLSPSSHSSLLPLSFIRSLQPHGIWGMSPYDLFSKNLHIIFIYYLLEISLFAIYFPKEIE